MRRGTLALGLTLGYAALFVASAVALFALTFAFLLGYMRERDRGYSRARLEEFAEAYARGGTEEVRREAGALRGDDRGEELLVRLADAGNRTTLLLAPEDWTAAEFASLTTREPRDTERLVVRSPDHPEIVEVIAYRFADGARIEVGMSSDERDDVAESFPDTFVAVSVPMLLLALLGGAFMAQRAVRPLRRLADTMRSIIETGDVRERAPAPPARGEVAELFRLFDRTFDRIEGLVVGLRETLDDVVHDLRTPLTRIRGVAEIALRDGQDESAYREALADVVEASEAASATLDAITDVAEAEAGALDIRKERVAVRDVLAGVGDLYAAVAEQRGISLVVEDPGPLEVSANPALLQRVIANLTDNALKYTPEGGRVVLAAGVDDGEVRIEVRDTGAGISVDDLPRIWDRHYRGDRSRSTRGLGLGLSLVRALTEAHGGRVSVSSVEGSGSTFTVHLAGHA
jgi:signal transduction histidine kinase